MAKNEQNPETNQDQPKKKESLKAKAERLKDEIIDEAKEIADGTQQSCYTLVMKTKELQGLEDKLGITED